MKQTKMTCRKPSSPLDSSLGTERRIEARIKKQQLRKQEQKEALDELRSFRCSINEET